MNNTKKNIYIVLLIISIIGNMILLYKKYHVTNYYKESYLVLQDGKQINIYSIDDSKKQRLKEIDNIQAMVGIVTKLEGKNNNFAVIFNEQRKCDFYWIYGSRKDQCGTGLCPDSRNSVSGYGSDDRRGSGHDHL